MTDKIKSRQKSDNADGQRLAQVTVVYNNRLLEVINDIVWSDIFRRVSEDFFRLVAVNQENSEAGENAETAVLLALDELTTTIQQAKPLSARHIQVFDVSDLREVLAGGGEIVLGIGSCGGQDRATKAITAALGGLPDGLAIAGAAKAFLSITGGRSLMFPEVQSANDYLRRCTGKQTELIWGVSINEDFNETVVAIVLASGLRY